ncbi:MAG: molybdotransferase-like divisome protein Glp [Streptosporangiaceae bacterium]
MQSVDSYLSEIVAALTPLPPQDLPITEAEGAVLAADATAAWALPGFDNSAMDGYAVIAADIELASAAHPVTLPVDAEVAAGDTDSVTVSPGRCVKIMTGALLPAGADAVVPVEWTDDGRTAVQIRQAAKPGNAIRLAGDDAQPGDLLLPAGTRLGAAQIGVLAAAGHGVVPVRRRPRVTVISTGNELIPPGSPLVPGQIWDSNSFMLAAAAREAGLDGVRHETVRDEPEVVLAAIKAAAANSDLLVTSGGVSMGGEHDVVKAALSKLGSVSFRKVAMQPGMPQGFGMIGDEPGTPIFTLPGNPVSAFVSFRLYVLPAGRVLQGLRPDHGGSLRARLTGPVSSPEGKRSFLRGVLDRGSGSVTPLTGQSSHQIASLARANALIVVPDQVTSLPEGEVVEVLELP